MPDRDGLRRGHAEATPRDVEKCGSGPWRDAHRQPWEVVQTVGIGEAAAGLQPVVGPQVQLKDVLHKAPPMAATSPVAAGEHVVVGEQRKDAGEGS